MNSIQTIRIQKKITVNFADGSRKQNLGVPGAAEILRTSYTKFDPIIISAEAAALDLVTELATELGRKFKPESFGYVLMGEMAPAAAPAPAKTNAAKADTDAVRFQVPHIILDEGLVFSETADAIKALKERLVMNEALPEGYKNEYTKTFARGNFLGQIKSLFKDYKKHGALIAPKINAFLYHNHTDAVAVGYFKLLRAGTMPHQKEALSANGKVDHMYFKFYALADATKG